MKVNAWGTTSTFVLPFYIMITGQSHKSSMAAPLESVYLLHSASQNQEGALDPKPSEGISLFVQ